MCGVWWSVYGMVYVEFVVECDVWYGVWWSLCVECVRGMW